MAHKEAHLDSAFIDRQRHRLVALHKELLKTASAGEIEESDLQARSTDDAQEYEDDAQKLTLLEEDAAVARHAMERVRAVERALQKIEDGTYGYSDVSNQPIGRAHLELVPEAARLPDE